MAFDAKKYMLEHGEKVVLGVVSVVSLLLLVFAFLRGALPENLRGEKLEQAAREKLEAVRRGTDIPETSQLHVPPADIALKKIDPKDIKEGEEFKYAYDFALKPWVNPVMRLKVPRPEPKYLAVRDLRVYVGRGHLNYKGSGGAAEKTETAGNPPDSKDNYTPPPGSVARAKHYVVVTGLVPLAEQRRQYEDTFTDTLAPDGYDGKQDHPEYYRYVIERAEVQPGMTDAQLQWTAINEPDDDKTTDQVRDPVIAKQVTEDWAATRIDVLPLALMEWCMVYVNPPPSEDGMAAATEGEVAETARWLPPRIPAAPWLDHEICHPEILKAIAQLAHGGGGGAHAKTAAKAEVQDADPAEALKQFAAAYPYRLLRHFDFDAQPGKQYKYRVTLVLRNPNRGFEPRYLDHGDVKLAEGKFRRSPATISPPATVPLDGGLLAGEVTPAPRAGTGVREPRLKVLVMGIEGIDEVVQVCQKMLEEAKRAADKKLWEEKLAKVNEIWSGKVDRVFAVKEIDAVRGSWMTLSGAAQIIHPLHNAPAELDPVTFRGDTLVCDFGGGVVLAGKDGGKPAAADSGDVLLLDGAGRLLIRNRYDDGFHYAKHQPPAAQAGENEMASAPSMTVEQIQELNKVKRQR